jgi:hypothetical protein
MKHAGPAAIAALEPLLAEIRPRGGLVEKRPGVFYRKGRACLHFHEDPAGLFADIRVDGDDFERVKLDQAGRDRLIALVAELGA